MKHNARHDGGRRTLSLSGQIAEYDLMDLRTIAVAEAEQTTEQFTVDFSDATAETVAFVPALLRIGHELKARNCELVVRVRQSLVTPILDQWWPTHLFRVEVVPE